MKICVFCASSESVDNVYFKAAADLGKEIVTRGWGLLYGGTNCGLMREVSDAVKNGGGEDRDHSAMHRGPGCFGRRYFRINRGSRHERTKEHDA